MSDLFVQSMTIKGQSTGTHSISSTTYIERMNMTCPKLILVLLDRNRSFQDDMEIKDGSEIELSLGDVDARGDALFKEKFIVGANWSESGKLYVEALQADIHRIKQAEIKPRFFTDKTPKQILGEIFSGLTLELDSFEVKRTYHVQSGATLAGMLNQMNADYGTAMWLCRGTLYMKKLSPKMKGKEGFKFEYLRSFSENQLIESYERYHTKSVQSDKAIRSRFGWDTTKGVMYAGDNVAAPISYAPRVPEPQLRLANIYIANVLDCTMAGNGDFEPFQTIELELNRLTKEQLLDESVDREQLIVGVRHYQQGVKFISVCELGGIEDGK